ncbi:MAG: phosphoserine phosphatase SerB [Thermodesulfobacteriota bacterium]
MDEDKDFVVVTVSGDDRPGILAALTKILVDGNVELVDVEQATLQDFLGLSFLLDMSRARGSKDSVLKELLYKATQLNLHLNFRLFSEQDVRERTHRNLFVLTYFSTKGKTKVLAVLSRILAEENVNIELITNLTGHQAHCVELTINASSVKNLSRLKERILSAAHELDVDLALQTAEAHRKSKRLIVFDMDSTLVDMELIDEMAKRADVVKEVSRITEKAMRGEMDFEDALRQRVALLKGLTTSELEEIGQELKLSQGVEDLVSVLKKLGYKLAVVSGGFQQFTDHLRHRLGLDYAFGNQLELRGKSLTGRIKGKVIDAAQKARLLNWIADQEGILLDQTVAIGDGANDALMLSQAGLGIAYNAREGLNRVAAGNIAHSRIKNILYILGVTESDIDKLI